MKKVIFLVVLAAGLYALGPVPPGGSPPSDLASAYLKGRVVLEPDPDFAKGADWEALFPTRFRQIAVAPDGSVFVSNSSDHNIYKFSPEGALVKTFGQHGQGPGDLDRPGAVSVLDDVYLVVGEYISNRRISLFKLDGTFSALFKTAYPASGPKALRDGKIAYVGLTGAGMEVKGDTLVDADNNRIMVLDTATGRAREISLIKTSMNRPKDGEVRIARSAEGDLLVGHTIRPEIEVYGPDGDKKGVIRLAIDPIPVTKKILEAHQIKVTYGGKRFDLPLGDFLPYYCDFTVDAEGNIIVFKMGEDPKTSPIVFQVYTPAGKFLCETELVRGSFDLPIDGFLRPRLAFTPRGIYGILPLRGDELETPRLFRVRLSP